MFHRYFRKLRAYNDTRRELNRLSVRELNDIGIGPADIDSIAADAFNRA